MSRLQGKIAIVTGGARDIGRAISVKLAKEGAKVVVNYHGSEKEGQKTVKIIEDAGGEAIAVYADVTKISDIDTLANKTEKAFGSKIDILVNNAGGLFARKSIEEVEEDFYNKLMDVNFKSTVFVTKRFVGMMGKGSTIVNLSSQAGRDGGGSGAFLYAASKGAVATFTRGISRNWALKVFG